MSERMNKERAKISNERAIKHLQELKQETFLLALDREALDIAITTLGAIEQIKWERDIAIQQLNELGYQFGEKIRSDE